MTAELVVGPGDDLPGVRRVFENQDGVNIKV
jgi:hypothetical protein